MLTLVNKERENASLAKLCYVKKLEKAADMQSTYNAIGRVEEGRSFQIDIAAASDPVAAAHTGKNGSSLADRAKESGYSFVTIAENVAWGQASVEEVMTAWMNSSGHKANILRDNIKHAGFAKVKDKDGGNHWTQVFGASGDNCEEPG